MTSNAAVQRVNAGIDPPTVRDSPAFEVKVVLLLLAHMGLHVNREAGEPARGSEGWVSAHGSGTANDAMN